ncbi:MAG: galactokinase [Armatimonadota bacterium]|nr:galactokinase [Armatimonadota bacterium]MDR7459212.1 galactokinase [Armatimonadota bacterium]MDR7479686.1 galactokinase [Armatimonadota bacterium]MDR7487823.1 galactokinase [Armatimonadota bacterium]MDR7490855.1 galactokinase [Armatimonadota bacterium]
MDDAAGPTTPRAGAETLLRARYGLSPAVVVRAPGRVNLIGEHTDYSEGFVLPAATDAALWAAAAPLPEPLVRAVSAAEAEETVFPTSAPRQGPVPSWGRYLQGMAAVLAEAGVSLRGLALGLDGDLPVGAGLSSSAALEIAAGLAFLACAGHPLDRRSLARLAQRAEVEHVGVRCGIMDQLAVTLARAGHLLLIDCRSLEVEPVPLPAEAVLVVCDTAVPRRLEESGYNTRREEVEAAARALAAARPGVRSLRDLALRDLPLVHALPAPLDRRARHVVTENARVLEAVQALRRGDLAAVGTLLRASHRSLRDDFEVSTPELEAMVAAAQESPGCVGARLVGAGFGGAVLALVERGREAAFVAAAGAAYRRRTGRSGRFLVTGAAAGAEVLTGSQDGTW